MVNSITRTYARQIEKARIPSDVAEVLVDCIHNPAVVFASIDRIFMKAKFSGLTSTEIIAVMGSGAFAEDQMDEKKLIALKPYLKIWPDNPRKAKMALDAGMSATEIAKIGSENISEESLKIMISLS
jgi:hypothetical protein